MKFTEKHIEWFDDFLSGKLDKKSKEDFEHLLAEDEAFNKEFNSYKAFCQEISFSLQLQLVENIKKGEKQYFHRLRLRKTIFLSLSAICILGLLAVLIFQSKQRKTILKKESFSSVPVIQESNDSVQTNEIATNENEIPENQNYSKHTKQPKEHLVSESKAYAISSTHTLVPYKNLEISYSGDTIVIKSNKEIKRFVSFEKDKKTYLLVGETLYYQNKDGFYWIEKDARVTEISTKGSGIGKSKTVKLMLYQESIITEKTESTSNSEEKLFLVNGIKVTKETYGRLKEAKIIKVPTKIFTMEDLLNLNSN